MTTLVFSDMTNGTGKTFDGSPLTQEVLEWHAAAIQEQLNGPFAAAWNLGPVTCRVGAPMAVDCTGDEWLMGYWQHPDQAGAAGYHAVDPGGRSYGKVFLDDASTLSNGVRSASVIASHEGLELRADPYGNLMAMRLDASMTWDMVEVADAVEDTTYKASNGVEVSNFLLPTAFKPGDAGPWDYLKVLSAQYGTTAGGYRITGTMVLRPDGSMRFQITAKGPAFIDEKQQRRKSRPTARAMHRGVQFWEE